MSQEEVARYLSLCRRGNYIYAELADNYYILGQITKV
jgi:hypothetical protein